MADLIQNRRRLMLGQPHLETASGSVVSFSKGERAPLTSAVLTVTRHQSGSGNPTPSNVRPISIWSAAEVHVSATNSGGTLTTINLPIGVVAGSVDLLAGTMTATEVEAPITAIGYYTATSAYVTGRFYVPSSFTLTSAISSHFSTSNPSGTVGRMSIVSNVAYFNMPRGEVASLDNAGVQKWVQDHHAQFVAVMSEARTYTFTPGTILTLNGQNYIWTEAGSLALTYWTH